MVESFESRFLPHARPVGVHLPPGYDLDSAARYPVLYLQDGQNLFDPATAFGGVPWHCDETADRLVLAGECRPVILVGVGNSPDRLREYGPRERPHPDDLSRDYARFLIEELKPSIDRTYRTLPDETGVGGSSMGGLISLHLAVWHPGVFRRCLAMSPSLWWDGEAFARSAAWPAGVRLWLDTGGREGGTPAAMRANLRRTRRLAARFRRATRGDGFRYVEAPDAGHNEAAWGARFGDALAFLFPA